VELVRPDAPNPDQVPYILVERVKYSDELPWPAAADGFGQVLQRVSVSAYGNDPANWLAGAKTPGSVFTPGGPPVITQQPADTTVNEGTTATITVVATGPAPLAYKWLFKGNELAGQTSPTLTLSNVRVDQAGSYSCLVYNNSSALISSNATLTVRPKPRILGQPANVRLRGSTNNADFGFTTNNANFSVIAIGSGEIRYQWRFNGNPIANATSPGLTIPNVGLSHDGIYDVTVTDDLASLTSTPAKLTVLIPPVFVVAPATNIVTVSNGTFSANVVIKGNPAPYRYEWREISTVRFGTNTAETTNFYTSGRITNLTSRTWRLVITNEASSGSIASFNVVALPDLDGDGLPDSWESLYGLNPGDGSDRDTDADQDGSSNYSEYLAGTDPTNNQSNLRVDIVSGGTGAQIRVGALADHTYTLQSSDDFGGNVWRRLIDIVAQPVDRVETISDPTSTTNRYYRLVTPRLP
jgi:hypothetical protein